MTNITLLHRSIEEFEGNNSWVDKLGHISMLTVQVVEVGPFSLKAKIYTFNSFRAKKTCKQHRSSGP